MNSLSLEKFVKENTCIKISNIKTIGSEESIGSFTGGSSALDIEEGIVFSTGNLEDIPGPNTSTSTTGNLAGPSNAPYLRRAVRNSPVFDAVGIEFDFESSLGIVSFSYVFASEEYCEYVDSEFNDAFGFFVSGPGINGTNFDQSVNIAKIPGKEDIVSINNVNHKKNTSFFVNNLVEQDANDCAIDYAPRVLQLIEFDGLTTVLQAFIRVIPCETYHLRMVVGDVSDNVLDSAVFLERNSFIATSAVRVEADVINSEDDIVFENCLEGRFRFARNKFSNIDEPITVNYKVEGTASSGTDFEPITQEVVIPANEFQRIIPLEVLADNLNEPVESVKIITETEACDCVQRDSAVLFISDSKVDIDVSFAETFVCSGQEFTLTPTIIEAIPPLAYEWNTGENTASITTQILESTSYSVTATDFCGARDSATIEAKLQPVPELKIEGNFSWCEGREPEKLILDLPGRAPWSISYSIDNGEVETLDNVTSNPFLLPLESPGIYEFFTFNDQFCNGVIKGKTIMVTPLPFTLEYEASSPSCLNADDGRIELNLSGGVMPYLIDWGQGNQSETGLSDLLAGQYGVTVTDQLGCVLYDSIEVAAPSSDFRCNIDLDANLYIPNAFSPNGDGINDVFSLYPRFGLIKAVSFQIYDRWGEFIFESDPMEASTSPIFWDGNQHQSGVYLCVVKVILSDDSEEVVGKDVTLLR